MNTAFLTAIIPSYWRIILACIISAVFGFYCYRFGIDHEVKICETKIATANASLASVKALGDIADAHVKDVVIKQAALTQELNDHATFIRRQLDISFNSTPAFVRKPASVRGGALLNSSAYSPGIKQTSSQLATDTNQSSPERNIPVTVKDCAQDALTIMLLQEAWNKARGL